MKRRLKVRAVITDFDGPVVHSFEGGKTALELIAVRYRLPYDAEVEKKVLAWWGHTTEVIVEKGLGVDPLRAHEIAEEWEAAGLRAGGNHIPPVTEGTKGLLYALHRVRRIVLTVLTNRGRASTAGILEHHRLVDYFSFVHGREDSVFKKPDPRVFTNTLAFLELRHDIGKGECVFVGDTLVDVECGLAAGIETVALVNGPHCAADVRARFPHFKECNIIPSMRFFLPWLEEYTEW